MWYYISILTKFHLICAQDLQKQITSRTYIDTKSDSGSIGMLKDGSKTNISAHTTTNA